MTTATETTSTTGVWGTNAYGEPVKIPVLGVTGPFQSGKTLFTLSIAPGDRRTLCYDFELSASGYRGLGFEYVDAPSVMRAAFGTREYLPIDIFRWWRDSVLAIEPGKFVTIVADPITDIESGMVDYVASQYAKHGFKTEQAFTSTGGIFWSKVREHWKRLLADLASRCETFAFTSHLRTVWINGRPTSKEKPGGKATLLELASLYLWLDRSADPKSGKVPAKPRCSRKLKDRVSYTSFNTETLEPVILPYLPPAFDDCTPARIREYLAKPADYNKLKAAERVVEPEPTEVEKIELQTHLEEARQAAEETALQRLQRQAELQSMARKQEVESTPQNVDESHAATAKQEQSEPDSDKPEPGNGKPEPEPVKCEPQVGREDKCTAEMATQIIELKDRVGMGKDTFEARIAHYTNGSPNPLDLTREQAVTIITKLGEAAKKLGK